MNVEDHINLMCSYMRLIGESDIPKRQQEPIFSFIEAHANIDTPEKLELFYKLLEVEHRGNTCTS